MKKRRIIASLLFLFGLAIVLYPSFSKRYYDYRIQEEVEVIIDDLDEQPDDFYERQVEYNQNLISSTANIEVANVSYVDDESSEVEHNKSNGQTNSSGSNEESALSRNGENDGSTVQAAGTNTGVLGSLHIPKIDLVYPIYDGATDSNLLKGVARIEGTSYPVGGINTNSVIAGHNSMARRNYFTHIKDLVNGDIVQIRNQKEVLTYEVYATLVIEPNDTGALAIIPEQDTITLLTCTWPPPGTHRYLVFAKRIADRPLDSVSSNN
ncbi:class C sortase [Alkalibacterium putridalgicola]|uniref:class C sortase n=1 Tax=Alkalibacterium putridalgicola TaxID=426703 RepID=UPI0034CEA872